MKTLRKIFSRQPSGWVFVLVGAGAFAVLLGTYIRIWSPDYGITRFIIIGHEFNQRGLDVYRATPKYMDPYPPDRWGFDGQYYAQIALDPLLRDPQIKQAIDNPSYRARRILLPWLAWLGGLGRPFWVLNVYAGLNLVFWLGFVVMMAVLFRPCGWAGVAGFAAMLLTCGIIESMHGSLTDFPAFVLMTLAVMIGGTGGAGMLALAALTREVDVLGLAGLVEFSRPWLQALKRNFWIGLIAAGPMLLWFAYIAWRLRMPMSVGGDNMDWPMQAIGRKLGEFIVMATQGGIRWAKFYRDYELHALLTIIATLTQCIYLLTHRAWENRLWRMAAVFVPFFLCIGDPAWESHFTVTRHALPITLGFNLFLAMRPNRRWLLWFLLGNCFVPYGVFEFSSYGSETPPHKEFTVAGARPADTYVDVHQGTGWFSGESSRNIIWRWAAGQNATLVISNRRSHPLEGELAFSTTSPVARDLRVSVRNRVIWSGQIDFARSSVGTMKFILPPGETVVSFATSSPPASRGMDDPRELTFMLADFRLAVTEPPPAR
ncbi:MAG TPA: hypothetical protein VK785_00210 [Opitutaceae bacterium]|nr:hypothetical protein [Opitutaceae bacterium]